jgi:tRNA(adenine34) deaminase
MSDEIWMRQALALARRAARRGEAPVGALVVVGGQVVGRAGNQRERRRDATAHAEILALRQACRALDAWRLTGASLYVTLEPCAMCAGAMVLARVTRLVYGARDSKAGAAGSLFDVVREPKLNHRIAVTAGVLGTECGAVLSEFFRERRAESRRRTEARKKRVEENLERWPSG